MAKMKNHKGSVKRFKPTARGKVRFKKSFAGHLMSGKSGNRIRRLRKPAYLTATLAKRLKYFTTN